MSRNLKTIIIIAAGILVLVIALIALSCEDCGSEPITVPEDSVSDSDILSDSDHSSIHLHYNEEGERLVEGDDIESVRLISSEGDFFIYRGSDGELTIQHLDDLLLETDFLELLWYNCHYFGYSYRIHSDDVLNLADYGLDPAALTVECTYTDGTFCRLFVGNETAGNSEIYYFRMEGRDDVYLNLFDISFFQGEQYWLSDDIFGDDADDVTIGTMKLSGSAFDKEVVVSPNDAADKTSPYYGSKYVITSPFSCMADDYLITLLTNELTELVADEAVCAHPTADDLARYGLDKPYLVLTHQRNGREHVLRVAKADASTLYAKADGVDCIYELSADVFQVLALLTPDFLRAPEIHVRYFDTIESIRIQSDDCDYTFRLERTPIATDNTLYEYRAFFGDTGLTLNYYKNLLEVFNSAASVSYGGKRESDTPAATVTIRFFDGFERSEEVIRYYPAGTRRYLVQIDSRSDALVSQMWLDKLLESAELLSRNEAVTP